MIGTSAQRHLEDALAALRWAGHEQRLSRRLCRVYDRRSVLGNDWCLTWMDGWDWAAWDCEHTPSGARLEIKQAAARQTWDKGPTLRRRTPAFDIAPRRGFWTREGMWIDSPGRQADIYVFAWHGRDDDDADHTDPGNGFSSPWRSAIFPRARRALGWPA